MPRPPLRMLAARAIGLWIGLWIAGNSAKAQEDAAEPSRERPVVLLLSGAPFAKRPGLEPALRIQLVGGAELRVRPSPRNAGGSLSAHVRAASAIAATESADWVVWADAPLATPNGELEAVLYLVGPRRDRALVEVVRVPAGPGPEVDRSLALKVGELVLGRGEEGVAPGVALGQPAPEPDAFRSDEARRSRSAVGLSLELGPELVARPGSDFGQLALWLGAGPSLWVDAWRLQAPIGIALAAPMTVESSAGTVQVQALAPRVLLRAEHALGVVLAGASLGLELGWVSAKGTAQSGARGEESVLLPGLMGAVELALELSESFALRGSVGVQQRLRRQLVELERRRAADLGRTAPFGRIALAFVSE